MCINNSIGREDTRPSYLWKRFFTISWIYEVCDTEFFACNTHPANWGPGYSSQFKTHSSFDRLDAKE
jgi:hypothetical protein